MGANAETLVHAEGVFKAVVNAPCPPMLQNVESRDTQKGKIRHTSKQCSKTARETTHYSRMATNSFAAVIANFPFRFDQPNELLNVGFHVEMFGPRFLSGVDVETTVEC